MKRVFIVLFAILNTFSLCFSSFVNLSDVKSGQKGIGITRWNNNTLKEFSFEVIGVFKNSPKSGVIIARIDDEEIRSTGVVAGMSGSPVYIDNKLVGAVAFTWTFLKEPIVGITPIEDMITLENYLKNYVSLPGDLKYVTPILLSGASKITKSLIESTMKDNFLIIDSFSSFGLKYETAQRGFKPGDAIGINLVSGDMELTAIGTVSYVDGDKVFALGHPAFLGGKTSVPISEVDIVTIVPRQSLSFKLGVPKQIVGSMEFDGSSGIFGIVGKTAPTIKVFIDVDGQYSYKYQIAKVSGILSSLVSATITESVLKSKGIFGEGNVKLDCRVSFKFEGVDKKYNIDFSDIIPVYQMGYGYAISILDVNSILDFLIYNPIFSVDIEEVRVRIETEPIDVGFVAFVIPSKVVVSPGEDIRVTVGIKKFRDQIITRDFNLKIPSWVQSGTRINIGAINRASRTIQKLNLFPETIVFDTYEKLYNFISQDLRTDKLVLYVEIPSSGYASSGYTYNLLPNYLSTVFNISPKSKNIIPFILEEEVLEDFPIGGFATTSIFVR
ncbi:MAG: SpoIVB peptidase S55 domain-containing protein [Spirochaetia bacterium]|nr:hypothetical protein [Spirochaetota bacterium]MCX8097359.1 hypothetical protein [Spirochaetota bacterium]MDW8112002.1 SpoIVB peptidase S55 domain-containing protein [Spirochaetia bacterium]